MTAWSRRTAQIDADAGPKIAEFETALGRPLTRRERTAVVKAAVLKTRPGKEHVGGSVLHARWAAEATALGYSPRELPARVRAAGRTRPDRSDPAVTTGLAVTLAGQRRAAFSRADLTVEVA